MANRPTDQSDPGDWDAPPAGLKPLAWEGVGLYVPLRWDLGKYEGDHVRGAVRVDGEDRPAAQLRWWRSRRAISVNRLVEQFHRNVLAKEKRTGDREMSILPTPQVQLPADLAEYAKAFVVGPTGRGGGRRLREITDVLICAYDGERQRAAVWRVLVDAGRPGFDAINQMVEGLRLGGFQQWRDWALLDFAFRSPPGARLAKVSVAAGVCYLRFAWRGGTAALRRFSAANAVIGTFQPDTEALERWCRGVYAQDFHDMRYETASEALSDDVHLLTLRGRRRRLAPLEARSLIPRHRKPPREIDIYWDRRANKICCFEIQKRTARNREAIDAMIRSYRRVDVESDAVAADFAPPRGKKRTARRRSLEARVRPGELVESERTDAGLVRLIYSARRSGGVRLLRAVGSLPIKGAEETQTVELDLIGSMIWRACRQRPRVCDLIDDVRRELSISHHEAERSVTEYVRTLGNRGLLSVEVRKDRGATDAR